MEYEKIKQLMEDMGNSKLTSLNIDFPDGTKISMNKDVNSSNEVVTVKKVQEIEKTEENIVVKTEEKEGNIVTSPMVGTFYSKPSPTEDPFVEIGKKVKKGDVLCIVEAMKLMNEISSSFDGEIKEIFVKDGEMVEYGKPLFRIV